MSKGGKGGGSVSLPTVNTNPPIDARTQTGFQTVETATGDLSAYLNSLINPSLSLGNWAAEQATGGFAGGIPGINPALDYPFGANTETGFNFPAVGDIPNVSSEFPAPGYAGIPGQAYATGSQPFSGTGGPNVPNPYYQGSSGTASPVGGAGGTWTGGGGGGGTGTGLQLNPGVSLEPTGPAVQAYLPGGNSQTFFPVGGGYYQQSGSTGINYPYYQLYNSGSGWQGATQVQAPIGQGAPGQDGGGGGGGGGGGSGGMAGTAPVDNRGPLLTAAEDALASEIKVAQQQPPGVDPGTIASLENQFFGNANPANIPGGTLPASGLYPNQQALIDTQVKSAQAATEQQLANEGLVSSTMGPELAGEIGLQGAAEAGTLIQGNLQIAQQAQQIAQNWAKLGMGEQTLGMAEQQQMFDFFSGIATQYGGLQQQMWSEAIQGYGVFSGIVNQLLSSYGLSTQQNADVIQGEAAQASAQATVQSAEISAQAQQSQSASSMFGALGDLFGSIGGGGAAAGAAGGGSTIADIAPLVAGLFL